MQSKQKYNYIIFHLDHRNVIFTKLSMWNPSRLGKIIAIPFFDFNLRQKHVKKKDFEIWFFSSSNHADKCNLLLIRVSDYIVY